jgi:hypothetical protein
MRYLFPTLTCDRQPNDPISKKAMRPLQYRTSIKVQYIYTSSVYIFGRPSGVMALRRAFFGGGLSGRVVNARKDRGTHVLARPCMAREHAGNHEAQLWFTAWAPWRTQRGREYRRAKSRGLFVAFVTRRRREEERNKRKEKGPKPISENRTHLSVPTFFMMVSLPDDAAFTICCSTDLFILALSA